MKQSLLNKVFLFALVLLVISGCASRDIEPYRNTSLSFEERTNDLVSRMTLDEKITMLRYGSPAIERLGVPEYNFWNECLHGVARSRATVFPQAIGMAAMWDGEEMFKIADAISDEARAKYHEFSSRGKRGMYQGLTYWTPNINIFRDPRWGRGMETYGEDPYLTAELAIPFIKGLQGDDPKYYKVIATAKHFAVHSGPEATRHSADVWPSDYDLAETYTPHFKRAVQEGKVYSVMCAYQSLRGAPCCGSKFLENLLRKEWGFEGFIVSDCGAVRDIHWEEGHHLVQTPEEASAMAVKAGTDLECGSTCLHLRKAIEKGLLTEEELDVSVKRVMLARMKLGQFDPDKIVPYSKIPYSVVDCKEHQDLSLDAARKSIVLLKNENNILPLSKDVKKVAVIGPNADDLEVLLGNYNGYPTNPKTPLAGIREKLPDAEVAFAQGCTLADKFPYFNVVPAKYLYTDSTMKNKGLQAQYYNNIEWKGKPLHERIDSNIDFVWQTTAPFKDMRYDHFSVRWRGVLVPEVSGEYALGGEGYSGFKFYLNDSLLTEWKSLHHPRKEYELVKLEAGKKYKICIEYFQDNTEYAIMRMLWDTPKPNLKEDAIKLAKSSDVVILCMGISPLLEGEEMKVQVPGFKKGDRMDIKLPSVQTELIKEIYKLGKPTVLVLLNGSALAFNWEAENLPAIVEAWYPGQAGGTAIADVLFGDYNPSGRLPITFYKSIDQIPAFENYDMKGKTYRYFEGEPLYHFGHGLSYSMFEYSWNSVPESVQTGDSLKVSVNVKNISNRAGDEIVQLYTSLQNTKLKVPLRSLQGFKRVHLNPGESKEISFILSPKQMSGRDDYNFSKVTSGQLTLSIGGQQPTKKINGSCEIVQKNIKIQGEPYYVKE